ncbi:MAG: bicyclomycin resistance protein [Burkholderiaceae bacterium]|nr:bicyclomycin resistance protein [Burkholderiaceae bacterium]
MNRQAPTRRRLLQAAAATVLAARGQAAAPQAADAAGRKVLRLLFNSTETSFDPARISDIYSRAVTAHIFEGLYAYDHLARPHRLVPQAAEGMPEVSADFRSWTIRIRRGIRFPDDPAFKGRARELQAHDFVYAIQRVVDPANISQIEADIAELHIVGLKEARDAALKGRQAFDYDRPIEGLRALDSHTLRIVLREPRPRLLYALARADQLGGQAREVVEFYGKDIGEHPVGTGPFRLKSWRRNSRIVLERNPFYRDVRYDAQPAPDDAEGQALLAQFKGRRLPMVDEVDISIIEEFQPEWLAFLGQEVDALAGDTGQLPSLFAPVAVPGGRLAPHLARRGVRAYRQLTPDVAFTYFNMDDPVVGGYDPAQVALRRAISLAYDTREELRQIRKGEGILAQSPLLPHTTGYEVGFKSEVSDYDPGRANALLDLYGFVDRDGDGWRERPDGSPLRLEVSTEPEQIYRAYNELMQKGLQRIGIRANFRIQQWPENLKAAEAGKLMIWSLGSAAGSPDGQSFLGWLYGPQAGNGNLARFKLPEYDRLYERAQVLPDGPERDALFLRAKRIAVAYMPYKVRVHRIFTDLVHPWVLGFRRPLFWQDWWHRVDIDLAVRARHMN